MPARTSVTRAPAIRTSFLPPRSRMAIPDRGGSRVEAYEVDGAKLPGGTESLNLSSPSPTHLPHNHNA